MGASRKWASAQWGLLLLAGGAMMAVLLLHIGRSVRADQANSQNVREIHLGRARLDTLYALTVWIKDPAQLQGNDAVLVTVSDASGKVDSKWLHAGDLVFKRDGKEVFRLRGVSRPDAFRQICLKARNALICGREVRQQQAAVAAASAPNQG